MIYFSILNTKDGYVMLADKQDYQIVGFEDINKGLEYYEKPYRRMASQGYTGAMSVLINNITFEPAICYCETFEKLLEILFNNETEAHFVSIGNVSGSVFAVKIPNQSEAERLWKEGAKPRVG